MPGLSEECFVAVPCRNDTKRVTSSARVPKQNDLRNFFWSDDCAEAAQIDADLA
jgi:hypothetical protein